MVENDIEKLEKFFFSRNNHDKKYLLSNLFEDVKNKKKKNLLPNQIKKYTTTINEGIDVLQQDDFMSGFYNKFYYANFAQNTHHSHNNSKNRISNLPEIKLSKTKSNTKPKFIINNIIKNKYRTNYNINIKNNFLNKTFNKNKFKSDDNNEHVDLYLNDKNNKLIMSRQSFIYPNLMSITEDKNFYIKEHNLNNRFNNITEEGKNIEKKLINNEKKKYFSGFKTKYKGLMKKSKKYVIDINEFINGNGGKNAKKNLLNKYKIKRVQLVLNQINKKIKNVNQKEKMKDIIEDVKQFKEKEKYVKNKFEKTDEKFNNLIIDSDNLNKKILKKLDEKYTSNI